MLGFLFLFLVNAYLALVSGGEVSGGEEACRVRALGVWMVLAGLLFRLLGMLSKETCPL